MQSGFLNITNITTSSENPIIHAKTTMKGKGDGYLLSSSGYSLLLCSTEGKPYQASLLTIFSYDQRSGLSAVGAAFRTCREEI